MRFYRVHAEVEGGISGGFGWHTAKSKAEREARKLAKAGGPPCEVEVVEVTPTKAGILRALRRYAAHPDNG